MDKDEIIALIGTNDAAQILIGDLAEVVAATYRRLHGEPLVAVIENVTDVIAEHIANVYEWTADRPRKYEKQGSKTGECVEPSQKRFDIVDDLTYIADLFDPHGHGKRLRGDRIISNRLIEALKKEGVLGPGLLSRARPEDFEVKTDEEPDYFGLGGESELRVGENLIFGFEDPSVFTASSDINARLLSRKLARAQENGGNGFIRADPVLWRLPDHILSILERAPRIGDGIDLRALRDLLDEDERQDFSKCCRQASHLLKIGWRMQDGVGDESPRHSTVSDFLNSPPFHRFVVHIFELLAPTNEQWGPELIPLQDILISKYERRLNAGKRISIDILGVEITGIANSATLCACDIVESLGLKINLFENAGIHRITEHVAKRQRVDTPDEWSGPNDEMEERKEIATELIIRGIWTIRRNWIVIRAYDNFFRWFCSRLMERSEGSEQIDLAGVYNKKIMAPMENWSSELGARFKLGLYYESDFERRADDKPLVIPEVPQRLFEQPLRLTEYFENDEYGAIPDPVTIEALLIAISRDDLDTRHIWSAVTALVDPYSLIPAPPSNKQN